MKPIVVVLLIAQIFSVELNGQSENVVLDEKMLKEIKSFFHIKEDKFDKEKRVWYKPKGYMSHNSNSMYCYFAVVDGMPFNFRIVINRRSQSGWLSLKEFKFNINEEVFELKPGRDDLGWDLASGYYYEWCDMRISSSDLALIEALGGADKVQMKYEGSKYYDTRSIPLAERYSIRKTLEYYFYLGGTF